MTDERKIAIRLATACLCLSARASQLEELCRAPHTREALATAVRRVNRSFTSVGGLMLHFDPDAGETGRAA
jgi:hypothetical protein